MESTRPKIILAIILALIITGAGLYLWQKNLQPKEAIPITEQKDFENWIEYKSNKGFSFKYPPGYGVNETQDPQNPQNTIIHIVKTDESGEFVQGATPSLQINVSENLISFALWEGMPWQGFPKIVETFRSE